MPRVRPRRTLRGRHTPFASRLSDALRPGPLPHPERFDPDRFLNKISDTYEWIPFGGGVRRCIGATFAHMEMDVVLRVLLECTELSECQCGSSSMASVCLGRIAEKWRWSSVASLRSLSRSTIASTAASTNPSFKSA